MTRSAVVLAFALAFAPAAARAELTFPIPAGWLDVSPGAPEENLRGLPADFATELRSGRFKAFAFDVAHAEDGFTPNLNAVVVEQRLRVRERDLDQAAAAIIGPIQQRFPGARLVEKGLVEVGGVTALRLVYDNELGGRALRQMAVVVPGNPSAVVTYSALRSQFDALLPTFDAHAASIRGAEERGALDIAWGSVLRATLIGGIAGALGGVALKVLGKRKQQA